MLEDRTVEYDYVDEVEIACERLIKLSGKVNIIKG